MGPVFRTYEPERDRLVAVKVFRLDITPEQSRALADELSRAAEAGLFHPSIVEPIAAGVEGSLAYGAEEYVAAESLDVAMRHYAPASIETVLPFITQLAGAIDFARTAGIGHGALHPRDIFMTPEEARATGFGVVEALERVGYRAPVRRPYSPPERIAGQPWGTAADVFSLAAITYELLTGRRPAGLGREIGSLTAGTPNEWMDALHAVLARAMQEDPGARYQTALAFAAALEAAARGEREPGADAIAPVVAREDEEGDIVGEQEEDEAHHRLMLQEQRARAEQEDPAGSWPLPQPEAAREDEKPAHHELTLREMEERSRAEQEDPTARWSAEQPEAAREEEEVAARWPPVQQEAAREDIEEPAARWPPEQPQAAREDEDAAAAARWPSPQPEAAREDEDAVAARWPPLQQEAAREDEEDVAASWPPPQPEAAREDHEDLRTPPRRAPVDPPAAIPAYHPSFGSTEAGHRGANSRQSSSLPLAIVLVLGLLVGFGGGYWLWGRSAGSDTAGSGTREFSEQAVAPPAGNPPAPSRSAPSQGSTAGATSGASPTSAPSTSAAAPSTSSAAAPAPAASGDGRRESSAAANAAPPKPAPPPAGGAGTIVVRSTPTGAGVTINGRWRGRTPLTLDELPYARYNVRVVQPGYATASESVTLSSGEPSRSLSFRLRAQVTPRAAPRAEASPAARPAIVAGGFTGSIYVDSRPRGAQVSINGKPVGVTPLRVPNVRIGAHVVRLELPDHRIWSSSARVTAGEEARVTGSLERIQ